MLDAEKAARLKAKVDDVAFKWITGTQAKLVTSVAFLFKYIEIILTKVRYVPELEQQDWAIVAESNDLCDGIKVIRTLNGNKNSSPTKSNANGNPNPEGIPVGIERARSPGNAV